MKEKIKLSGVCKELHRKIHYKNASGEYICLETDNLGETLIKKIKKDDYGVETNFFATSILIKSVININFRSKTGNTALILACSKKHTKTVKLILKDKGFQDINNQNTRGETAFMKACIYCHTEIVKILLEYKGREGDENIVDVNLQDNWGDTSLIHVVKDGIKESLSLLLPYNNNERIKKMLNELMKKDYTETFKLLVKIPSLRIGIKNFKGGTALEWAIRQNKREMVELLEKF